MTVPLGSSFPMHHPSTNIHRINDLEQTKSFLFKPTLSCLSDSSNLVWKHFEHPKDFDEKIDTTLIAVR